MRLSHFFIERPIFSAVLCILIVLLGALAYTSLPVAQYPQIAPPTIQVHASYPGASAEVAADSVATPREQEINGVQGMIYMLSQSRGEGNVTIAITFELGTDLDTAQVLVQNRVAIAEPRLPEQVRRLGVVTQKRLPDLMLVINLFSPDDVNDQLYIANYATLQVGDRLARIPGVGQITLFGASEYAMRVWLDPDRVNAVGLTTGEVLSALRGQNIQVSAGVLNQAPSSTAQGFEVGVQTLGRLRDPAAFESIVVKAQPDGRLRLQPQHADPIRLGARYRHRGGRRHRCGGKRRAQHQRRTRTARGCPPDHG